MMFTWILLIPLLFYLFSKLDMEPTYQYARRDAEDILRERYARGEIDIEEFEERKRALR